MSAGFPKMVFCLRGRMANKADYVRRIWEQYAHSPVKIANRTDLKYTSVTFRRHWKTHEFLLVEHAPDYTLRSSP